MTLAEYRVDSSDGKKTDRLNAELHSRVTDYLLDRNEHAFRLLHVEVDEGTVTLNGRVRSYYEKQVATSCQSVEGVLNLINNLTVPEWENDETDFPFTL